MESNVAMPPEFYISLFAGAAGLDLSLRLAMPNGRCVGFVEREIGAARILAARMEDGSIDEAPIWSDVRTFPSRLYRDRVAGIAGGFPCTDLSVAGKRAGITGEHSGLWFEYLRIIREVQPRWVFIENVPAVIAFPAGGIVLGGLAEIGFDAEWLPVRASDVGMPHKRERVFIYAWDRRWGGGGFLEDATRHERDGRDREVRMRRGVCEAGDDVADHNGNGRRVLAGGELLDSERAAFGNHANGCDSELADAEGAGCEARDREPVRSGAARAGAGREGIELAFPTRGGFGIVRQSSGRDGLTGGGQPVSGRRRNLTTHTPESRNGSDDSERKRGGGKSD